MRGLQLPEVRGDPLPGILPPACRRRARRQGRRPRRPRRPRRTRRGKRERQGRPQPSLRAGAPRSQSTKPPPPQTPRRFMLRVVQTSAPSIYAPSIYAPPHRTIRTRARRLAPRSVPGADDRRSALRLRRRDHRSVRAGLRRLRRSNAGAQNVAPPTPPSRTLGTLRGGFVRRLVRRVDRRSRAGPPPRAPRRAAGRRAAAPAA